MIEEGKLKVATGYFDIRSGAVTLLEGSLTGNCIEAKVIESTYLRFC